MLVRRAIIADTNKVASAETRMNSNYKQFLDTIVELHKAMVGEKMECLAHEFYRLAVARTAEEEVQLDLRILS
jgi:hypothetical protein